MQCRVMFGNGVCIVTLSPQNETRPACVCVFLFFLFPPQNIESSLNKNKTLGSTSIGVLYLVNIFVSYAAKDFVARKSVGPKRAMVLGAAQYVVFSAANLYATWLEKCVMVALR